MYTAFLICLFVNKRVSRELIGKKKRNSALAMIGDGGDQNQLRALFETLLQGNIVLVPYGLISIVFLPTGSASAAIAPSNDPST